MDTVSTYAVIAGETVGAQPSAQWLSAGISFDLEKRLGRLSGLSPTDRLQTVAAVQSASSSDPQARVNAVMERLRPAFVLYIDTAVAGSWLDVTVRIFTSRNGEAKSLHCRDSQDHLFALIGSLTGRLVSALRDTNIDPGTPCSSSALCKAPAKSVDVFRRVICGMLAVQGGRPSEAKPELVSALEIEPDNWWGHYFLGALEFQRGRLPQAATECEKAIALDPDLYAGVYANLAYCYQGLGQMEQAGRAQREFEQRTGKLLPPGSLPGGPFSVRYPGARK